MSQTNSTLIFSPKANLADPRLGAKVIYASDEFFARKERLIKPETPVFIEDKYDDNGKWMDGWETRRKRTEGFDYCIIQLGSPATIENIELDTSHFTGNFPPAASIDACYCDTDLLTDSASIQDNIGEIINADATIEWFEMIPTTSLDGNSIHTVETKKSSAIVTHLRLNIYPDGGIARLRVFGQVQCDWDNKDKSEAIDLLSTSNGGRAIVCNDEHYGNIKNLLLPDRGINMGDGWETRRRREPGNDWIIFQLGHPGTIESIEVDTAHFKGNFPDSCSIQAAFIDNSTDASLVPQSLFWQELLPKQPLSMDSIHRYSKEVNSIGRISHIRFNIFPDGGISRLRLYGKI